MDDLIAAVKARGLVNKVTALTRPVDLDAYLSQARATVKLDASLPSTEPGYSAPIGDQYKIVVNKNDSHERQRFTTCHELGHIVLNLPSEHQSSGDRFSYKKRPDNEVYCDIFAAELLLPYKLFKPLVRDDDVGFDRIAALGDEFEASLTCTGSRYAANADFPCAFVLSEGDKVRFTSRSKALREMNAWVPLKQPIPINSKSAMVYLGNADNSPMQVPADIWFENWKRGGTLLEEARYFRKWDQLLTLLWFDDGELGERDITQQDNTEEDGLLQELTGELPWPGKRHRR